MSTYEEFETFCMVQCFINATANYTICTETNYTDCALYPKRIVDLEYLVPVTFVFFLMFLSGLLGNLSVCTVILKHPSMRTEINAYLFSLAASDILLLFFGLVPELWHYWQMYPYQFGEFTCRITTFLAATGTWASALTVVAFSIERYIAICHHSRFSRGNKRVTMAILAIWVTSVAVALPVLHVYHVVTNPNVVYPGTGKIPLLTQTCRIPPKFNVSQIQSQSDSTADDSYVYYTEADKYAYYKYIYAITCVVFFFIPMAVLMLMYIKIALYIRKHRKQARNNGIKNNCSENTKIFKVLVTVVLAFFVCGAPFHYQRLTALHSDPDDQEHKRKVLVITGLFYYLSAAINPIIYNAISRRYRKAFKEIISGKKRQNDIPLNTAAKNNEVIINKMGRTNSYTTVPTSA